jgi:hypothetical protein
MSEHLLPVDDVESSSRPPCEERRVSVRFPTSLQAEVHAVRPASPAPWLARVRDISAHGIGLVLPHPVEPGALLTGDVESPSGNLTRTILARVVHVTARARGEWVVGCALVSELSDADLGAFRAERVRPAAPDCRAWVRFPCNVETICYSVDTVPGEQLPARILNISAGGLGLLLPCQFESRTLLNLLLPPQPGEPPRRVLVRVVTAKPYGQGDWFLGCEFADQLSDEELAALR